MTEKFNVNILEKGNITCVYVSGQLDAHTAPKLEEKIQEQISNSKYKVVLNLNNLDYISSAGLGVFMSFLEEIRQNDGDLVFCNLKEKVFFVFELLGFPELFKVFNKEEEALNYFKN